MLEIISQFRSDFYPYEKPGNLQVNPAEIVSEIPPTPDSTIVTLLENANDPTISDAQFGELTRKILKSHGK